MFDTQLGTLNGFTDEAIHKKYKTFEENMDHIFATYKTSIYDYDLVNFYMLKKIGTSHIFSKYCLTYYEIFHFIIGILSTSSSESLLRCLLQLEESIYGYS